MTLFRFSPAARLPVVLLAVVAGLCATAPLARADVFTIRGIKADAIGEDVIEAKQSAIRQGQFEALERLWTRLVRSEDRFSIPAVDPTEVERFVQNFSVSDEKTSDVRYLADMAVQFNPSAVSNHLRLAGVPFVDKPSPIAAVLPVFDDDGGAQTWQEGSPWLDAWVVSFTQDGLSPIIAPLGDLADLALIDAERGAGADSAALADFAKRNGATNALVAHASLQGESTLDIRYREVGLPDRAGQFALVRGENESVEKFLQRGVVETQARLEQAWRRANTVRFDQQAQALVLIPLRGLTDWIAVQQDLGAIPAVADTRLVSLTREAAIVDLGYYGSSDQLDSFFRQRRLSIRPIDLAAPEIARLLDGRSSLPAWQIDRL